MSGAKLYRVRVTEIRPSFTEAWVYDLWVAANSRREAIKRARGRVVTGVPDDRIHIHVSTATGGVNFNRSTNLRTAP